MHFLFNFTLHRSGGVILEPTTVKNGAPWGRNYR